MQHWLTPRRSAASLFILFIVGVATASLGPGPTVPTTDRDFQQPGTQPETLNDALQEAVNCSGCHGNYDPAIEPYTGWVGSMMAQSTRDPIFHAALAIANQDAGDSGELCIRCHSPAGWLDGNSQPTDGSGLDTGTVDYDGVTCHFCHRMVDPVLDAENPAEDSSILAALAAPPMTETHTGQYVVDPDDNRRGPFELPPDFPWHEWRKSPFHQESLFCATCHDVSNPVFSKQLDGTYDPNPFDNPHPTHDKRAEFPIERTYSEWKRSLFFMAPIEMDGRFGGNKTAVQSCQDCHMPDTTGAACSPGLGGEVRDDMPLHTFAGANSWVLRAIRQQYPDLETGLSAQIVNDSIARNVAMLQNAADLFAFEQAGDLVVRVVNQTGHKLPTGYGEGRRMWINVKFFNAVDTLIGEHGFYDNATYDLTTTDTTVYEIDHGLDNDMAAITGMPAGKSFHFVLNNTTLKDNRIPPRGFNNISFANHQADVVAYTYPDEHYWDDVTYTIPAGAARVEVNLFHQTTTKEYIEFLRDENTTNSAGQDAYDLWDMFGNSAPVLMANVDVDLGTSSCGDPIPYGLGEIGSSGMRAEIGWNGTPSMAAGNFELTLTGGAANQFGAPFSGPGAQNVPFAGGNLLVTMPLRGAIFMTDGNGEATIPVAIDNSMVGTQRYYQIYFRDPGQTGFLTLTNALFVEFCD